MERGKKATAKQDAKQKEMFKHAEEQRSKNIEVNGEEEVKVPKQFVINKEGIMSINKIIINATEAGRLGFVDYEKAFRILAASVSEHAKPEY